MQKNIQIQCNIILYTVILSKIYNIIRSVEIFFSACYLNRMTNII